ncbi:hypothetical protein H5410_003990 [Solanum commersonii]|uniref:Uncharacterized protein n=1 Tax=Solanum commersonii TaxID=4109 RepID=A0A9J6B6H3_SOLCO|nr:hypothetical protein H5410_003990 [Solanum commersonii]
MAESIAIVSTHAAQKNVLQLDQSVHWTVTLSPDHPLFWKCATSSFSLLHKNGRISIAIPIKNHFIPAFCFQNSSSIFKKSLQFYFCFAQTCPVAFRWIPNASSFEGPDGITSRPISAGGWLPVVETIGDLTRRVFMVLGVFF